MTAHSKHTVPVPIECRCNRSLCVMRRNNNAGRMRANGAVVVPRSVLAARRPGTVCSGFFPCQTGAHGYQASIFNWVSCFLTSFE